MAVNGLVFVAASIAPQTVQGFLALHAGGPPHQYVTYAFLHQGGLGFGLFHLATNMLFFWIFGSGLESRIGPARLLGLYGITAVAGAGAFHVFQALPGQALLGASGAVYGTIGAFLILFPFSSVKCLFVLLIFVVPLVMTTTNIATLFFLPLFWAIEALIPFLLINVGLVVEQVPLATSAHLGGLATGAGLAALFYGFYGFSPQAEEDQVEEQALQSRLSSEIQGMGLAEAPRSPAGPSLKTIRDIAPGSAHLRSLHENVILGHFEKVRELYHKLTERPGEPACLTPGVQMDLARMLMHNGEIDLAIKALDQLIVTYPEEPVSPMARMELARLLAEHQLDPGRAHRLLHEFLQAQPPMDLETEARDLLESLATPSQSEASGAEELDFGEPVKPFFETSDRPIPAKPEGEAVSMTPPPEGWDAASDRLFGDPEDSSAGLPPRPAQQSAPADSGIDNLFEQLEHKPIRGDETEGPKSAEPASPCTGEIDQVFSAAEDSPEPPKNTSAHRPWGIDADDPTKVYPMTDHPIELDSKDVPSEPPRRRVDQAPSTSATRPKAPPPLLFTPEGRYAILLAPRCRASLGQIAELLVPFDPRPPEEIRQSLSHRNGILAEQLDQTEARRLSRRFARHQLPVMVVDERPVQAFAEPVEVRAWHPRPEAACFSTDRECLETTWSHAVAISAAMVTLEPMTPMRAVLDLFFTDPPLHVRIWANNFIYPPMLAGHGEQQFLELGRALSASGGHLIATGSFRRWIRSGRARPDRCFSSRVEYDDYNRYYLLAYHAPGGRLRGEKGKAE